MFLSFVLKRIILRIERFVFYFAKAMLLIFSFYPKKYKVLFAFEIVG